ncbi:MAG: hypothetical protein AB1916_06780 [Thermodesulfobacteriota bacterium]
MVVPYAQCRSARTRGMAAYPLGKRKLKKKPALREFSRKYRNPTLKAKPSLVNMPGGFARLLGHGELRPLPAPKREGAERRLTKKHTRDAEKHKAWRGMSRRRMARRRKKREHPA